MIFITVMRFMTTMMMMMITRMTIKMIVNGKSDKKRDMISNVTNVVLNYLKKKGNDSL